MPRLERIEPVNNEHLPDVEGVKTLKNGVTVEDLPDYSKKVIVPNALLPGGLIVVFRDPTQEDLEFFESQMAQCPTKMEAVKRLGCRLCIQWGDRSGVTPPQWNKLRATVSATLLHVVNNFFPGVDDF